MFQLILLSVILIAFAFLALAVKMFFKKGGQFTKTCASIDEKGQKIPCICKDAGPDKCENYDEHHKQRENLDDMGQ